jgi:dipeptidyl aminopeptidase/acylaminoacyl peptidase
MNLRKASSAVLFVVLCFVSVFAADKQKVTLDEFFNSADYTSIELSPDGRQAVVVVERADWDQSIFRTDLWLYREGNLVQLTRSGHDTDPQWSPDGKWIAFLSDRKVSGGKDGDSGDAKEEDVAQIYLIPVSGGEAFPVTRGEEDVHAFAWSRDSQSLFYAIRTPWTKKQKDDYKKEWKDTEQYRASERPDVIYSIAVATAQQRNAEAGIKSADDSEDVSDATPGSHVAANTPWRVARMAISPDGKRLAFVSESISQRNEMVGEFELYLVDLASASANVPPRRLTHNEGVENAIRWAPDSQHLFFSAETDVFGKYRDLQPHLYWIDTQSGAIEQWGKDFIGAVTGYAVTANGVLLSGRLGTEVAMYSASKPADSFLKLNGWAGTYETIATAENSPKFAFVHSTLEKPTEVYFAEDTAQLASAHVITSFNKLYLERDLPKGKPYRWKAEDGTTVEGMLMYPPGQFEAKNLPMFVLIHGGPADADGNHFEMDWYQWDRLAANAGWLVFEPNYRGSTGYGDKFLTQIVPQIVSRPGEDILAGVDALVKDGIADPNHLAVGGYSYGGYMTNWLITQTARFKAAVTGAGAVEHVANWGNDDTTFDDAYFLGGLPWEAAQRYHDEAAIYFIKNVKTPTHMVAGSDDIRVAVLEDYLLEHALHNLGIPNNLLIFPGEGHSLAKNPWHGKIKVREELKWLKKYGGVGQ